MKHSKFALILALTVASAGAWAKLPPPSEEAKVKAEEAKVKAAETAKMEGEQLGKAQDRVAEKYIKEQKAKGVTVKPTPIPPPPPAAAPAAPAAPTPAAAPVVAPAAKK
ncbi:formate dehydrogenase [Dechloromonas sp. TW-R-39-2]|uniref:hypothetical protein n=1 Tax=Dechloromonas sp. TW-R-39-2 TaxID=2654218 RepID=UPI00193D552B|nr:hypothetical protein [Dechloromonas sp. TW-R-39-2]QRM17947.1 formate dehydrogenase [Dechloromonas sp. TW-R-39-2]